MLTNEFFNSFIGIYRPYIKRTQPILDEFDLHTGQWLVLRDIANSAPTTLVQISKRRFIEKPTTRKIIKALSEKELLTITTGQDKREKILNLSEKGQQLFTEVNYRITPIQNHLIEKSNLTTEDLEHVISTMAKLHQTLSEEEEKE
ncbi:MarR family winged helix-turn-helix transcriptional regulator [Staphylococcus sp. Marseille-Q1834]|uniref:MarR family winged helix-turn-helix transcriptional regulator n=1 Tax=Staphylococcus sp. Marseille-Q1834 TaxID=2866594 RepID=UPI0012B76510|nr:MarR family transcriptional regulator [Staphylococcus sp. Marseille-Q1834]